MTISVSNCSLVAYHILSLLGGNDNNNNNNNNHIENKDSHSNLNLNNKCYFGLHYKSYKTELFCEQVKKLVKIYYPNTKLITFYRHGTNLLIVFFKDQIQKYFNGIWSV